MPTSPTNQQQSGPTSPTGSGGSSSNTGTTTNTQTKTNQNTLDFTYDYHDDAIQNAQGPHIPGTALGMLSGENTRSRYPRQISLETIT